MRARFVYFSIFLVAITGAASYLNSMFSWLFVILGPIILLGFYDMIQSRHTIMRNFPLLGRARYWMEDLRPKLYQYFIESDIDGRPFNRTNRSVVYQRAKNELDTSPFGTQLNVYEEGYEWVNHSIAALDPHHIKDDLRVTIGGPDCKRPYAASLLNVSAMSFGSLSNRAILALNGGAKIGGFAHNTGEGGISPYHLNPGGDLVYQIGTGYFGCRNADGTFSAEKYKETVTPKNVKMIELKLSQGAKPGHGGILPAKKNTEEIAKIRGIKPFTSVHSPPFHSAFSTPKGLLEFIKKLRDLADGRPVGFKLCIGKKHEFLAICKAMLETGIKPDFITIDGGEGGTGAAPIEFSDSVGMPLLDGLAFAYNALIGFDLKKDIKLIASGKVVSGFHIFRALAIGADLCQSARAMMLALGCIQSLECNKNSCPTGVATQKKHLIKGIVVKDKEQRVAEYQKETLVAFKELLAATGLSEPNQINRSHINRNETQTIIRRFDQAYPYITKGSLLQEPYPEGFQISMEEAQADSFAPAANWIY